MSYIHKSSWQYNNIYILLSTDKWCCCRVTFARVKTTTTERENHIYWNLFIFHADPLSAPSTPPGM